MPYTPQISIPAYYMRGGTSKGVFFDLNDLPESAQQPGAVRDALLLRVIGSPDPYTKHTDGMGGATSSTSKVVIVSKSTQPGHDIDYLFGQVSIDKPFIDWSGNCGNLTSAVGVFAIHKGIVDSKQFSKDDNAVIKIWQANIKKTIVAHIPLQDGEIQETGAFELDGVTFPAAEIKIEFIDPSDSNGAVFPTGNVVDDLDVPGIGKFQCTMINAGIPTVFITAESLGYDGTELQNDINSDVKALKTFEVLRAYGAVKMGLITDIVAAADRQHTPKIAFVAKPKEYTASSGKTVSTNDVDILVRAFSMGKLHHAMMGTAAVAIASATAIPGTLLNQITTADTKDTVRFGHPSGTMKVGAEVISEQNQWRIQKVSMSRSARRLMSGQIHIPGDVIL